MIYRAFYCGRESRRHPVFYVGRLKRYVDPRAITHPHESNVSDYVDDHASIDGAGEGTALMEHYQPMSDPRAFSDLRTEEDCASNTRLSSTISPEG